MSESGHSPGDSQAATRFGELSCRAVADDADLDLAASGGPPRYIPIAKFLNFWRVQVRVDP